LPKQPGLQHSAVRDTGSLPGCLVPALDIGSYLPDAVNFPWSAGTRYWAMILTPLQCHRAHPGDAQLARLANLSHVSVAFVAGRLETHPDVSVVATKTASWHGCRGRALVAI
jgi:hypothetical protein